MLSTMLWKGMDGNSGGNEDGEDEYGWAIRGLFYCFSKILTGLCLLLTSGQVEKWVPVLLIGWWCWACDFWAFINLDQI